jgi:hypothetical protein
VPWNEITGTARFVGHGAGNRRPLTGATAANTVGASQASWLAIRAPPEKPVAYTRSRSVSGQLGDYETAVAVTTVALALALERGAGGCARGPNEAISLYNLGSCSFEAGDRDEARRWLGECLVLTNELGYNEVTAYALATVVRLLLA